MRRALVVLAVLLVWAPPAGAALRPQVLVVPGSTASSIDPPSIAVGADGTQAVAWATSSRGWVAVRRAGARRFGRPVGLARGARMPRAVVLPHRRVVVLMLVPDGSAKACCTIVGSQLLPAGRRRAEALQPVSVPGVAVPPFAVAAGGGGALAAAAIGETGVAVSDARGRFASVVARSVGFAGVQVAVGRAGRGAAVWVEGDRYTRLVGAALSPGHVGRARTLLTDIATGGGFGFFNVAAGADARGRVTVLSTHTGSGPFPIGGVPEVPAAVRAGVAGATGPLRHRQTLESHRPFGAGMTEPSIAVAPSGAALAAWRAYDNIGPPAGQQTVRLARRSSPTGRFRMLESVGNALAPVVALRPDGRGALVYAVASVARVRRVSPAGRLGAPQELPGAPGEPGPMSLGVAAAATAAHRITLAYTTGRGLSVIDLR